MNELNMPTKTDVELMSVIGRPSWAEPYAGTGVGMPRPLEAAINVWNDVSAILRDANHVADAIDADDERTELGKSRIRASSYEALSDRIQATSQRLKNVTIDRVNLEIHLERDGRPVADPADQRTVAVWAAHADTSQLELNILYSKLIDQDPEANPNAPWMATALETMVSMKTGELVLSAEQIAEGRRKRGARKDPVAAAMLATLRRAEAHLTSAHQALESHVRERFEKADAGAIIRRGGSLN